MKNVLDEYEIVGKVDGEKSEEVQNKNNSEKCENNNQQKDGECDTTEENAHSNPQRGFHISQIKKQLAKKLTLENTITNNSLEHSNRGNNNNNGNTIARDVSSKYTNSREQDMRNGIDNKEINEHAQTKIEVAGKEKMLREKEKQIEKKKSLKNECTSAHTNGSKKNEVNNVEEKNLEKGDGKECDINVEMGKEEKEDVENEKEEKEAVEDEEEEKEDVKDEAEEKDDVEDEAEAEEGEEQKENKAEQQQNKEQEKLLENKEEQQGNKEEQQGNKEEQQTNKEEQQTNKVAGEIGTEKNKSTNVKEPINYNVDEKKHYKVLIHAPACWKGDKFNSTPYLFVYDKMVNFYAHGESPLEIEKYIVDKNEPNFKNRILIIIFYRSLFECTTAALILQNKEKMKTNNNSNNENNSVVSSEIGLENIPKPLSIYFLPIYKIDLNNDSVKYRLALKPNSIVYYPTIEEASSLFENSLKIRGQNINKFSLHFILKNNRQSNTDFLSFFTSQTKLYGVPLSNVSSCLQKFKLNENLQVSKRNIFVNTSKSQIQTPINKSQNYTEQEKYISLEKLKGKCENPTSTNLSKENLIETDSLFNKNNNFLIPTNDEESSSNKRKKDILSNKNTVHGYQYDKYKSYLNKSFNSGINIDGVSNCSKDKSNNFFQRKLRRNEDFDMKDDVLPDDSASMIFLQDKDSVLSGKGRIKKPEGSTLTSNFRKVDSMMHSVSKYLQKKSDLTKINMHNNSVECSSNKRETANDMMEEKSYCCSNVNPKPKYMYASNSICSSYLNNEDNLSSIFTEIKKWMQKIENKVSNMNNVEISKLKKDKEAEDKIKRVSTILTKNVKKNAKIKNEQALQICYLKFRNLYLIRKNEKVKFENQFLIRKNKSKKRTPTAILKMAQTILLLKSYLIKERRNHNKKYENMMRHLQEEKNELLTTIEKKELEQERNININVMLSEKLNQLTEDTENALNDVQIYKNKSDEVSKKYEILQETHTVLKMKLKQTQNEKEHQQEEIKSIKKENDRRKTELKKMNEEMEQLKKQVELIHRENEYVKKEYENVKMENENVKKENEHVKKEYEIVKKENESVGRDKESIKKEYEIVKKENEKIKKENENVKKENEHVKKEYEIVKKENENVKKEYEIVKKENENVKKENENVRKENESVGRDKESIKKEYEIVKKENEKIKKENENVKKENESVGRDKESIRKEYENIKKEDEHVKKEYEKIRRENERIKRENEIVRRENETLKRECNYVKKESENFKNDGDQYKQKMVDIKKEKELFKKEWDSFKKETDDLKKENEKLKRENEQIKREKDQFKKEKDESRKEYEDIRKEKEHYRKEKENTKKENENLKKDLNDSKVKYSNLKGYLEEKEKIYSKRVYELEQNLRSVLNEKEKSVKEAKDEINALKKAKKEKMEEINKLKMKIEKLKKLEEYYKSTQLDFDAFKKECYQSFNKMQLIVKEMEKREKEYTKYNDSIKNIEKEHRDTIEKILEKEQKILMENRHYKLLFAEQYEKIMAFDNNLTIAENLLDNVLSQYSQFFNEPLNKNNNYVINKDFGKIHYKNIFTAKDNIKFIKRSLTPLKQNLNKNNFLPNSVATLPDVLIDKKNSRKYSISSKSSGTYNTYKSFPFYTNDNRSSLSDTQLEEKEIVKQERNIFLRLCKDNNNIVSTKNANDKSISMILKKQLHFPNINESLGETNKKGKPEISKINKPAIVEKKQKQNQLSEIRKEHTDNDQLDDYKEKIETKQARDQMPNKESEKECNKIYGQMHEEGTDCSTHVIARNDLSTNANEDILIEDQTLKEGFVNIEIINSNNLESKIDTQITQKTSKQFTDEIKEENERKHSRENETVLTTSNKKSMSSFNVNTLRNENSECSDKDAQKLNISNRLIKTFHTLPYTPSASSANKYKYTEESKKSSKYCGVPRNMNSSKIYNIKDNRTNEKQNDLNINGSYASKKSACISPRRNISAVSPRAKFQEFKDKMSGWNNSRKGINANIVTSATTNTTPNKNTTTKSAGSSTNTAGTTTNTETDANNTTTVITTNAITSNTLNNTAATKNTNKSVGTVSSFSKYNTHYKCRNIEDFNYMNIQENNKNCKQQKSSVIPSTFSLDRFKNKLKFSNRTGLSNK